LHGREYCLRYYRTVSDKRIDQFDDVLPFDNEELFIQNNHLASGVADDVNRSDGTFEDENLYDKLTACIEGLDSVSDSETSDGATEKSNKPSSSVVSENGIRGVSASRAGDDRVVAEVLDDIVDKIVNHSNVGADDIFVAGSERTVDDKAMCVPPAQELRCILDQFGADNAKLQNLIKTFQQHYEESTVKVNLDRVEPSFGRSL
jgi:hypothetical protein